MLMIDSLTVAYGDRLAINHVSFSLSPGSILGVIGPNGSGKTTLIRALSGILPIRSGKIEVNGKDLAHLDTMERARMLAVVPQVRQLPAAFTAREVVLLGRTPHLNWLGQVSGKDDNIASQAMERTHTLDLADRRISELSGGEQQRVLLARALAQSTPILLMDEPTTYLDMKYQFDFLDQVRQLVQQETLSVLLVLHDLNLVVRFADRVALLYEGELKALGKPEEVLDPALLSEVYHLPLQVISSGQKGYPLVLPNFG